MKKASAAKKPAAKTAHTTAKSKPAHTTHTTRSHTTAAKSKSAKTTKKATIGGKCAWISFGVKKPWYRRGAQELSVVAKIAGYERTWQLDEAQVVGLQFPEGYHAARVVGRRDGHLIVDLWGERAVVDNREVQEGYRAA